MKRKRVHRFRETMRFGFTAKRKCHDAPEKKKNTFLWVQESSAGTECSGDRMHFGKILLFV